MVEVEAPAADRVDSGSPLPRGNGFGPWFVALLRRAWRQLTSMRTALVLLFLLAVAAIPGSLLPQRSIKIEDVNAYLRKNPDLGRTLDRFYLFDVFSSPWFSAIYLLLFVSLVGCLVPRLRTHVTALLRQPPDAPARLNRMPAYAEGQAREEDLPKLAALLRKRRFRVAVRGTTVSAEKGYLKETGNLLFHFSLLALLVSVAVSHWYGWHGSRNIVAGPDGRFCNTLQQYDDYGLGARVGAGDLPPFCMQLDRFETTYTANGQPTMFRAYVRYSDGRGAADKTTEIEVNHPLRVGGAGVYLLGRGYAPIIRYTDRFGKSQTSIQPFIPNDDRMTSSGVATFPDANVDPATRKQDPNDQIGFQGLYLPTMSSHDLTMAQSLHPDERNPRLLLVAYRGNLGMDAGLAQSVFTLDQSRINSGKLQKFDTTKALKPGEAWPLPDGSKVEFLGTRAFATMTVRHDPGEMYALGAAVCLLVGLLMSLWGKRRRIWLRVDGDRVEAGGLPRTDYSGFQAEFDEIVQAARKEGTFR
ncbi:cytochrome c biogenesis protein ResB [Planosporangium flavigriseum]|uniref:Cytochrome c biogenesis protein n=1 Tax=Planosporangium flavigriseum TaxID=373681 RepID=A0A8J3LZG3_9ACTN|nr:cytochrome c biogenesis protein ResB [Planosporangium flavigriseum]NJC64364.1 cytochrome c biogenesis protein ResB [Planosporangium flavigriseum]GIG73890.1 cytochrome c biogenesis protein [Planosporangium flavigriseum]